MNSEQNLNSMTRFSNSSVPALLCHFAFWFGVLFATPVFVADHNLGDLVLSFQMVAGSFAVACIVLTLLSYALAGLAGRGAQRWICRILLAIALVSAVQGNIVNDLFYYGAFNGEKMLFRSYGLLFYAEWLGYLLVLAIVLFVLFRLRKMQSGCPCCQ